MVVSKRVVNRCKLDRMFRITTMSVMNNGLSFQDVSWRDFLMRPLEDKRIFLKPGGLRHNLYVWDNGCWTEINDWWWNA